MYLSKNLIKQALGELELVHPFYGITFLVAKEAQLPVGNVIDFDICHKEQAFFELYYRPNRQTAWYYRVFRAQDKQKYWLRPDYPSKGGQAVRTQTFGRAFIHDKNSSKWGWQPDYVDVLKASVRRHVPIPTFYLAVWLYRDRNWPERTTASDILQSFVDQFRISPIEQQQLFEMSVPMWNDFSALFGPTPASWEEIETDLSIPLPDDLPPEREGNLLSLGLEGVGPAEQLSLEFAQRVNLITGDNGLGKTFILECAWWALSGKWAGSPVYPREDTKKRDPRITFEMANAGRRTETGVSQYDWKSQTWDSIEPRQTIPGLLVYARVDGAFAVWDPARRYSFLPKDEVPGPLIFSRESVWDGLVESIAGRTRYLCNGLISDWVTWQNNPAQYPFETLKRVLRRLSPPSLDYGDLGPLEPGKAIRIPGGESRWIPTIRHPYGEIPLVYTSAGIRRIVALAYLIVWTWEEHKANSAMMRALPQRQMVVLIDEIEAHLHPQWQRVILPSLLDVHEDLEADLQIQFLAATHSPFVMASMEPHFNPERDRLFHLNLKRRNLFDGEVVVESPNFYRYGTIDSWVRSDFFELGHARSLEAEKVLEDAKALQSRSQEDVSSQDVQAVSKRLQMYLSDQDPFWPRWVAYAERHGVTL